MNIVQRIRQLTGTPDPAADPVRIVDAMARERASARLKLNSAIAELFILRQRRQVIERRMAELINRVAMLDREVDDE